LNPLVHEEDVLALEETFELPAPELDRQSRVLLGFLSNLWGPDRLVLRAGKLEALALLRSDRLTDRLIALQRLVYEDPTIEAPENCDPHELIAELEDQIADLVAMRTVEENLDRKIAVKMEERHRDYLRDLRREALKEDYGPETSSTLKKLDELKELELRGLDSSALSMMRPQGLDEVVGQDEAVDSLFSKLGTPYPQHVILYGPPGVGKTTVARLILDEVKSLNFTPFRQEAPFVEVDATVVRWDPREITNPLLGSVHDPIYQGSKKDFGDEGIPEPKVGLVTKAHGGVLFIDEIGELDPILQNKLLKVLEDKRILFESSYFDDDNPRVPEYIRRLFTEGAPADFILVGATTRDPEDITPAIRSRCAEVFFKPLSPVQTEAIVKQAARRLGVTLRPDVAALISRYTSEGRKAVRILADSYGRAHLRKSRASGEDQDHSKRIVITAADVRAVLRSGREKAPHPTRAGAQSEIGAVLGLGVKGFQGAPIEVEAAVFLCAEPGKGTHHFNRAAGEMAHDSFFNATSVIRRVCGDNLGDYDVHVNVVGGGKVDGPSAGLAVVTAIVSSLKGKPIPGDIAMTGEISLHGKVKPVGGVVEKIYGAQQADIRQVFIPVANAPEVEDLFPDIEVVPVARIEDAFEKLWGGLA
jgi:ATP-dependent Lon protease